MGVSPTPMYTRSANEGGTRTLESMGRLLVSSNQFSPFDSPATDYSLDFR